jgi:hypothetical protein
MPQTLNFARARLLLSSDPLFEKNGKCPAILRRFPPQSFARPEEKSLMIIRQYPYR